MQDYKVSIILPTRDKSKYLGRAIKGCLEQTYKNIELIIVDDCSDDDSANEIIESFNDKRIRYYKNTSDHGISNCLNFGLEQSEGDYITFISDDSFFESTAIKRMLSYLLNNNEKFVYTSFYCFNNVESASKSLVRLFDTNLMETNCFECFLFDRGVFITTGYFDKNLHFMHYYDYLIRVTKKFKISFLNEPLYYSKLRQESLSSSDIKNFRYRIEHILVKYKNSIIKKDSATESLMDTGIKYISEIEKGSLILDLYLKSTSIYKPYIMQKIEEFLLNMNQVDTSIGSLKNEIEEFFLNLNWKLTKDNFEELKKMSCMIISQKGDTGYKSKIIKELMSLLLEREMYELFNDFKRLFSDCIAKDYVLLCNISGLEFNYKFKKSIIDEDLILMEAGMSKGIFINADTDIQKEFFTNLAMFKRKREKDYYLYKLKEEFSLKQLYCESGDILSFLDFFNDYDTKKFIYEKALSLATDNAAILNVQNKIQELYHSSMKK